MSIATVRSHKAEIVAIHDRTSLADTADGTGGGVTDGMVMPGEISSLWELVGDGSSARSGDLGRSGRFAASAGSGRDPEVADLSVAKGGSDAAGGLGLGR